MTRSPIESRPTLSAVAVRTRFGVSRDVPFTRQFFAGERVLIRGRSGVGKSVLLGTLGLLVQPVSGSVVLGDHEASRDSQAAAQRRRQLAYVFQESLMIDHLSVEWNLRLAVGGDPGPACRLLDQWGVPWRGKRPANLSSGERQRAAVAAAVAKRPPIVLADEPTSSLDDASRLEVKVAFDSLPPDSTVVVASHDRIWLDWATHVLDLSEEVGA
jgi:ABC-type lipoprotein export system ATPase subunit